MKKIIISLIFVVCAINNTTAQKVTPSQLKIIEGAWVGSLTYLDYKSGKPFTMPANITFQQSKDNPNIFLRSIGYSTEPHANQKDSMIISMDGRMIDEYTIISNIYRCTYRNPVHYYCPLTNFCIFRNIC